MAEEERFEEAVGWDEFVELFYQRIFHASARRTMECQFMDLQQRDRTVDAYAVEFIKLSRFAPAMVAKEEDRAYRFHLGLRANIRVFVSS
ncbi:hypothetical protein [Paenibacillus apiarius]|uniref:hypothetical protein n=1 Tax=Paenibacillus apiarius TaxID=46240 RepID=UPI003B3A9C26